MPKAAQSVACCTWCVLLGGIPFLVSPSSAVAAALDAEVITKAIKKDVADIVAGLNAHDVAKTTAYDAEDIVSMECGSPPMTGIDADRKGFQGGFANDPDWKVALIDETVDVAGSGDLAIYRGTYNEDNRGRTGAVMTHRTKFIAEFRLQADGAWKMVWYMVANMERSHPK